ncbi:MAG: CCA tRNA nucleotidyltransferase [Deltaproteobacteria bacterium]|nr:MAG: CCA tRNA nucleotidyltransferase [Deltaproteobacteria bacterium]
MVPVPPRTPQEALALLERAPFPDALLRLLERLASLGHEAYIVGGCVRDVLLGRPLGDFDVATSARPEEVRAAFRRTIPTGIDHGTVTVVLAPKLHVEVTTYRGEGAYEDGRRPSRVVYHGDLHADLARRDFTINAFAYRPRPRTFIDDFDGLGDLGGRRIRAIGDPVERFREDGLRPMRAVRFCATLEFDLDPDTHDAISETLDVFVKVAAERIRDELWKLLGARRASLGLRPMWRTGLWRHVLPEPETDVEALLERVDRLPPDPPLRLAALLDTVERRRVEPALSALKISNRDKARIRALLTDAARRVACESADTAIRRAAAEIGREAVADALAFHEAPDEQRRRVERALRGCPMAPRELAISGRDLAAEGIVEPGPQMGRCLARLFDYVLEDPARNERQTLLAHARKVC